MRYLHDEDMGAGMGWEVVERRIGKAGDRKQRGRRQREWDRRYGEDWAVGYVIDGVFVLQEDALHSVYHRSYEAFLDAHPEEVDELVRTARALRNPHAEATGGVDLQVPAIRAYLQRRGRRLQGDALVDIGSFGDPSHAISVRLSPLTIPCVVKHEWTLEAFWQKRKCLAVWR
jgi:hypothetical protein